MTMTDLPTWTEEYRTADRSNWRTGGAWEDEPDKVVWVDEATGLDCMARRGPVGAWCGYVGVTEVHPWHGQEDTWEDRDTGPVWWFGFDTAHAYDAWPMNGPGPIEGDEYRVLPYIVEQVQGLARQLAEAAA